jgi:transposase
LEVFTPTNLEATGMVNATDTPTVLLGLDGFVLLAATDHDHELVLLVETIADRDWCRTCGTRAGSKGRARVTVRDVPVGDRPVMLVWKKRVWRCEQLECPRGSWRETSEQIRPRVVLTERARRWAVRRVGQQAVAVSQVADDLGVGWHTVNDAVIDIGTRMIDGDDRLDEVRAVGVDEHNVLRGTFNSPTTWGTAFVDLDSSRLLDVVENRTAAAVRAWFAARGDDWCGQIEQAALDPYEGYATALRRALPDATLVVDHFHLIRLGNQVVDEVRRRTQQETLGHRGRKGDPLYEIRKLLLVGVERLDDRARRRIAEGLAAGDRYDEVACAWAAKQMLRDVYAADHHDQAAARLETFLTWADEVDIAELSRLARTVRRWRTRILAYHDRQLSNGRTEAMILLIKRVKRIGFGFRNFRNYRVRLLLHCGVKWDTPPTTKIRGRAPSLAA